MVRISVNLGKKAFLLLNEEAGRRKAEGLPRHKNGQIMEDALVALLNVMEIKFTAEVSPYIGLDGKEYGPFKEGTIATLPVCEAVWIMKGSLGVEVNKDEEGKTKQD